jgi:hypothetical protein
LNTRGLVDWSPLTIVVAQSWPNAGHAHHLFVVAALGAVAVDDRAVDVDVVVDDAGVFLQRRDDAVSGRRGFVDGAELRGRQHGLAVVLKTEPFSPSNGIASNRSVDFANISIGGRRMSSARMTSRIRRSSSGWRQPSPGPFVSSQWVRAPFL